MDSNTSIKQSKVHRVPFTRKLDITLRLLSAKSNPKFASLFITRTCNFQCPYCKSILQPSKDITLDQWKIIIDKLHSFGVRLFTLTGGEPLIRPDILEIIQYITQNKRSICWMISNFSLVDRLVIDNLDNAGLQFITSSFDTLTLKSEKSDRSVLDHLAYAKSKGIIPSTLTVVTSENIKEIPAIFDEVTSRGIMFDMGLYQHVGGEFSPDSTDLKPGPEKVAALLSFLKKKKITGYVSPSWRYLSEPVSTYQNYTWKCSSEKDNFIVVNNDGLLMPCQEYSSSVSLFDIDSLENTNWKSEKSSIVQSCNGCFYGCYFQKTHTGLLDILFDAWSMLKL